MTLYAHSSEDPTYPYQSLNEHLAKVGKLTSEFLYKFDPQWGMTAGMTHDLGKACSDWQAYLIAASSGGEERKSPGHDFQGAVYNYHNKNLPLAFMVAGHHRGLMDLNPTHSKFDFRGNLASSENKLRCDEAVKNLNLSTFGWDKPPLMPSWIRNNTDKISKNLQMDMFIRMGFSALIDADRLDTEEYSGRAGNFASKYRSSVRGAYPKLTAYGPVLQKFIDSKSNTLTKVNTLRSMVVKDCRAAGEWKPGAYTLTVPTGGGKTLSSLAFSLIHAEKYGHRRVIIALPYTSIIDQTADVFRSVFKELGTDVILEHHSNLAPEKETSATKVAVENWDAPLIITTQVQLFDSLFSNHPSECRKLHNLQDSIIILDEVQTLPVKYLTPILSALQELIDNYGVTVLLTTATQPSLEKTDFFPGLSPAPKEIISPETQTLLWDGLKRVQTYWPWEWACPRPSSENFWSEMAEKVIESGDSSLTICHLKKHSRKLFEAIRKVDNTVLHLSAAMCSTHRRKVLTEVKRRLAGKLPCRLVSTQVIEAGVDIDFPVVFRAMAGLESLAQSAGRCNREGKLETLGQFFIFIAPEKPPGSLCYNLDTAVSMIEGEQPLDLFTPETFVKYFEALYLGKSSGLDKENIQGLRNEFNFKTVSRKFRLIPDLTDSLLIPYNDEAKKLIKRLEENGPSADLFKRLQAYTVNVYPKQLEKLMEAGQIVEQNGIFSLIEKSLNYSVDFGIYLDDDNSTSLLMI